MDTKQQNKVTMLQTVLRFLDEGGQPLLAIKRIAAGREALAAVAAQVLAVAKTQEQPTTGVTRTRETVKKEAAERAEVLRLFVVALTDDPTRRAALKQTVGKRLQGKDAEYLAYLAAIAEGIATLQPADLADAGYDPKVLLALAADRAELEKTQGAARQIEIGTSAATDELPGLLQAADAVLAQQLDPLVRAQALAQPALVAEYDKARRILKTAARRRPRYRGLLPAGTVGLVFDRRTAGLPDPTLGNRSGRGRVLRFYTAATPTARPLPGQGVPVKHRTDLHLADYARLGPDADAPYLLVVLEGVDGEGHFVVE